MRLSRSSSSCAQQPQAIGVFKFCWTWASSSSCVSPCATACVLDANHTKAVNRHRVYVADLKIFINPPLYHSSPMQYNHTRGSPQVLPPILLCHSHPRHHWYLYQCPSRRLSI